jgi:hypothetical protein
VWLDDDPVGGVIAQRFDGAGCDSIPATRELIQRAFEKVGWRQDIGIEEQE